jgi:hypothetical protein
MGFNSAFKGLILQTGVFCYPVLQVLLLNQFPHFGGTKEDSVNLKL